MRIAIVHDYLNQFGGAERVLSALMEAFPNAPVFTLLYDGRALPEPFDERRIHTSWLQRMPGARRHHRYFPLLMPLAVEQFDLRNFDVVFSATHSFGKGIITSPHTLHISYCFTPTRYVWDDSHKYVREFSRSALFQKFAPLALSYIRLWDYYASQRVDTYVTLSHYVARRIKKYYGRQAQVVPPPVNVKKFRVKKEHEGYYLVVSRLVPYKRVDLAIEACERMGRRLIVVGTGPEMEELRARARLSARGGQQQTEFRGFVSERELARLYQGARALLFPQEEDFGITPLEAAASGKPTVAFAAGGALETIREGETGIFFDRQEAGALIAAMKQLEGRLWHAPSIRAHAEGFGRERFLQQIREVVHNQWMAFASQYE